MILVLEDIAQLFGQLVAVKSEIPQDIIRRQDVINRAIDIQSASMNYLAIAIRHHSTPLGTVGKPEN